MIRINLAPADERPLRRRLSPVGLAVATLAVMGALGASYAILAQTEAQLGARIAASTRELAQLQAAVTEGESARSAVSDLARRMQAIHELTRGQGAFLRALDALLDAVPPELWLTALDGRGPELRATGLAPEAPVVATFTANLRASGAFRDVEIALSRQDLAKTPPGPLSFEVTCRLAP